jgi:hypothetical protein
MNCTLYAIAAAMWLTAPAWGQDMRTVDHSTVELAHAPLPAVAEVYFDNSSHDGERQSHTLTLTLGGLNIEVVAITGDTVPDTISVTAPEGYVAIPDEVTIRDGEAASLLIYPIQAVGM